MKPLSLQITGMSCAHCLNAVNSALGSLPGVSVKSARIGRADVEFDPDRTSPEAIIAAVEAAGYSAAPLAASS